MNHEPGVHVPARPRRLPAFAFLLAVLVLGVIVVVALRAPEPALTGLPADSDLAAVRDLVQGRLRLESGELRFHATLLGEGGAADVALAVRAGRVLHAAGTPWPGDPRRLAAIACLDLAAHRHREAERLYRRALDLAPDYGEARLGLGVALALRADTEGDAERARGLRLRAISQFAAVAGSDPMYEPALHNRALLLARVGRTAEARDFAAAYLSEDSTSAWADAMRRERDAGPQ